MNPAVKWQPVARILAWGPPCSLCAHLYNLPGLLSVRQQTLPPQNASFELKESSPKRLRKKHFKLPL